MMQPYHRQAGYQGFSAGDSCAALSGAAMFLLVGRQVCSECHSEINEVFIKSGHPWKLNKVVDGQPPAYPFTEVLDVCEGYIWDDITYVIGGHNWKARFSAKTVLFYRARLAAGPGIRGIRGHRCLRPIVKRWPSVTGVQIRQTCVLVQPVSGASTNQRSENDDLQAEVI